MRSLGFTAWSRWNWGGGWIGCGLVMRSLACVELLVGPAALGQDDGGEGEKQGEESKWGDLTETSEDAVRRLRDSYPDILVEFGSGRISMIYGQLFGGGLSAADSAGSFVTATAELFGLTEDELILSRVTEPETEGDGPWYFTYHQVFESLPIDGATLTITVAPDNEYAVTRASSTLWPSPGKWLEPVELSAEEALQSCIEMMDGGFAFSEPLLVIAPLAVGPRYAWQVLAEAIESGSEHKSARLLIDATDGRVIAIDDLDQFASGTVKGKRSSDLTQPPDCSAAESSLYSIAGATVFKDTNLPYFDETSITNSSGQYFFTCQSGEPYSLTSFLRSNYFDLKVGGATISLTKGGLSCPTSWNFEWIDSNYAKSEQLMNTWHWLHTGRLWARDRWAGTYTVDESADVFPNESGCATRFSPLPRNIHITSGGVGVNCACDCDVGDCDDDATQDCKRDYHFSTIVAHELGHKYDPFTWPPNSQRLPWTENFADAFSSYVCGTSKLGEKLCECTSYGGYFCGGRDLTDGSFTPLEWPSFAPQDNYSNGRPVSAAFWDMRTAIGDTSPNYKAGRILLHTVAQTIDGVDKDITLQAVLQDDDPSIFPSSGADNVISNGSPNYEKINEAFRRHGLATNNIAYKPTFAFTDDSMTDPLPGAGIPVSVNVGTGGPALISPGALRLRYRIPNDPYNSGWQDFEMNGTSQTGPFTYTIPGTGRAAGDWVDWYIRAETVDSARRYVCSPLQAQFVFDGDTDGLYIPEERTYYTSFWTVGSRTNALTFESTSNQEPSGWTKGGGWAWGAPIFTTFGEQPDFDYPYDATGSTKCYVTGNIANPDVVRPAGGAPWALTTTEFDLTGVDAAVVSYALWFFERGGVAEDKFTVEIGDGTNWVTPALQTISPENSGEDERLKYVKRIRWVRQRLVIPPGAGQFTSGRKLRFTAARHSTSTTGEIEACVDEVRVWRLYAD